MHSASITLSPGAYASTSEIRCLAPVLRGLSVCFLAGTLGQGGAERQLFYMLQCLSNAGAIAHLLSLTQGEYWEAPIRSLGVPVHWVGQSSHRLGRLIQITRVVSHLKPQVVQAQHFYMNLYAVLAARYSACHHIGAVRNDVLSELADVGGLLSHASLRLPRMLAANSRSAARNLSRLGVTQDKVCFVPNMVGQVKCDYQAGPTAGGFLILGVGRLVPQKRFDLFLHVLAKLPSLCAVPLRAIIAGEGPQRGELESLACRLGLLPDKVRFVGRVEDLAQWYQRAHLLLLTSDHEGTPNVVLESMAAGLPVVATRAGDVPTLLGEGVRGVVVGTGDVEGLVRATAELLRDSKWRQRLSARSRLYVAAEHSCEALQRRLNKLYGAALAA